MKPCPYCGEQIQDVAIKCRFCGEWLDPDKAPPRPAGDVDYGRLAREVAMQLTRSQPAVPGESGSRPEVELPLESRGLIPLDADAPAERSEGRQARPEPAPRLGVPAPAADWSPPAGTSRAGQWTAPDEKWNAPGEGGPAEAAASEDGGGAWEPPPWLTDEERAQHRADHEADRHQEGDAPTERTTETTRETKEEPQAAGGSKPEKHVEVAALGELSGRIDKLKETAQEVRRSIEADPPTESAEQPPPPADIALDAAADEPPPPAADSSARVPQQFSAPADDAFEVEHRTAVRPPVREDEFDDDMRNRKETAPLTEDARSPEALGRRPGRTPVPSGRKRGDTDHDSGELDTFERGFLGDGDFDDEDAGASFGDAVSGAPARKFPVVPIAAGLGLVLLIAFAFKDQLFGSSAATEGPGTETAGVVATEDSAGVEESAGGPALAETGEAEEAQTSGALEAGTGEAGPAVDTDGADAGTGGEEVDATAGEPPDAGEAGEAPEAGEAGEAPAGDEVFEEKLAEARKLYKRKKFDDTIAILDEAFGVSPDNPQALMLLSAVQLDQGKLDDALQTANRCVQVDTATADCWLTIAVLEKENANLSQSKQAFERYLELDPQGQYAKTAKRAIKELERDLG